MAAKYPAEEEFGAAAAAGQANMWVEVTAALLVQLNTRELNVTLETVRFVGAGQRSAVLFFEVENPNWILKRNTKV